MARLKGSSKVRWLVALSWISGCSDPVTTTGRDAGPEAEPSACAEGTWDHDGDSATSCVAWTDCAAGTFVSAEGSPTADRRCTACPEGTFSDTVNAPSCAKHTPCAPGTRLTAPGTSTTPAQCDACSPGTYCAGGTAALIDCAEGTWDHDADPTTTCVAWTDCVPGEFVGAEGSSTTDRGCLKCTNGEHTATINATRCSPGAWVLSYFGPNQDVRSDSLHLAYSTDGLHWSPLADGQPAYRLTGMGTNHIRDPFLFRKNDGTFVYIATDWTLAENDANYWNRPSSKIFVADSSDLITFTNPRLLTLTNLPGPNSTPMHAWAPEAYYDPDRELYAIIWSGNDTTGANRIYVSYTEDFVTIVNPTPDVLFDPGYSVIDATITQWNGRNYLFFKDETDNSGSALTGSGKDIQIARSPTLALDPATFTRWSPNYITRGSTQSRRRATEGPFVIKDPRQDRWYLFADYYLNGGVFGCWTTTDLDTDPGSWTELPSTDYSFPSGVRHASAVRVTQAELDALIAHY